MTDTITPITLTTYASTDGVLPFQARVQIRRDDRWEQVAQGSSVTWLTDTAQDEADQHGASRVVSKFGTVLGHFTRQ